MEVSNSNPEIMRGTYFTTLSPDMMSWIIMDKQ